MGIEGFLQGGEDFFVNIGDWIIGIWPSVPDWFLFPGGLILLLFLIPFIILYMIRPKPQKKTVSSLMFLMKEQGRSFVRTFFRTFIKDVLFFIQLLALLLMILAIARPFLEVDELVVDKPSVIILDASASMGAGDRMDEAKELAKDSLSSLNTVILAKNLPQTLIIEQGKRKSSSLIDDVDVSGTETNLYDALILAPKYLRDDGRVVVVSDFAADPGFLNAKRFLESQGHKVHLRRVASEEDNVGIVDAEMDEQKTVLSIKNFGDERSVHLKVNDELVDSKTIAKDSSEVFSFTTPPGLSTAMIDVDDGFGLDNTVYMSAPQEHLIDVLIISNDDSVRDDDFVLALEAINSNSTTKIRYEVATPPKVPPIHHDLIIFKDVNPDLILPGTIEETEKRVKEGGAAIVMIQDKLFTIDFKSLLPYSFVRTEREAFVEKSPMSLTENVDFGTIGTYYVLEPRDSVISIASVGESPILAYNPLGNGLTVYYGLYDESADFGKDPYYPIFWKRLIDFLSHKPDITSLNYRTGRVLALEQGNEAEKPDGDVKKGSVLLDQTGFYRLEDRTLAANLISLSESSLTAEEYLDEDQAEKLDKKPSPEPLDLSKYFIIAALVVIGFELFYLKFRGDL